MKYSDIVRSIMDKYDDPEVISAASDKAIESLKATNRVAYDELMNSLEELYYSIDTETAQNIVRKMMDRGEVWSISTVEEYLAEKGITDNIINWYLVMNVMANDYQQTAERFIETDDQTEFYFSLAKDFITDKDGRPFKVEKYFME